MITGRCLCGAVHYEAQGEPAFFFNCYCATCRRESGAGHATILLMPAEGFTISGPTKTIALPRAGAAAPIPRTFCTECGSTLFAHPDARYVNLRAGTVDQQITAALALNDNADQAQAWDCADPDVPTTL